jgi:hypothetical protein
MNKYTLIAAISPRHGLIYYETHVFSKKAGVKDLIYL